MWCSPLFCLWSCILRCDYDCSPLFHLFPWTVTFRPRIPTNFSSLFIHMTFYSRINNLQDVLLGRMQIFKTHSWYIIKWFPIKNHILLIPIYNTLSLESTSWFTLQMCFFHFHPIYSYKFIVFVVTTLAIHNFFALLF